jgi:hypothetical protein
MTARFTRTARRARAADRPGCAPRDPSRCGTLLQMGTRGDWDVALGTLAGRSLAWRVALSPALGGRFEIGHRSLRLRDCAILGCFAKWSSPPVSFACKTKRVISFFASSKSGHGHPPLVYTKTFPDSSERVEPQRAAESENWPLAAATAGSQSEDECGPTDRVANMPRESLAKARAQECAVMGRSSETSRPRDQANS